MKLEETETDTVSTCRSANAGSITYTRRKHFTSPNYFHSSVSRRAPWLRFGGSQVKSDYHKQ